MENENTNPSGGAPTGSENDRSQQRRERATKTITCEFCKATLSPESGDVIRMSDDTRAMRDAAEKRDEYKNKVASLETKVSELNAEIARLKAAPAPVTEEPKGPRIHVHV